MPAGRPRELYSAPQPTSSVVSYRGTPIPLEVLNLHKIAEGGLDLIPRDESSMYGARDRLRSR
jgi:hypothetical protein